MPQTLNWVANYLPAYEGKKKEQKENAFAGLSVEKK